MLAQAINFENSKTDFTPERHWQRSQEVGGGVRGEGVWWWCEPVWPKRITLI